MPIPIEYNPVRRMSTITVPKQDINFDAYDFQLCQPQNDIKGAFESRELEATYCRDFACCGLILEDLHDLLQHYEECHVRIEEEEQEDDDIVGGHDFYDDHSSNWSISSSSEPSSPLLSQEEDQMTALKKKAAAYLSDLYNVSTKEQEATGTTTATTSSMVGKKRSYHQATMDLITQSAVKKMALSGPLLTDEDFLAQAGALLATTSNLSNEDKPYKCPVRGCDKAYKNPNGLKYHNQHGHCNMTADETENMSKPYQCTIGECGKRYKNLNGLKYHIEHSHMAALNQTLATFSSSLFSNLTSTTDDLSTLF